MAKKTYICQGGYLGKNGKLEYVEKDTEVTIEEKIGDKSRLLTPKGQAKKLVVNTDESK